MPRYQVDCRPGTRMILSNGDQVQTDKHAQIEATPEQAAFIARLFHTTEIQSSEITTKKVAKGKSA